MDPQLPFPEVESGNGFTLPHTIQQHKGYIVGGGLSLGALGVGFEDCLFDLKTVDACVAHASGLIGTFQSIGMHLIQWAIAIFKAAFGIV